MRFRSGSVILHVIAIILCVLAAFGVSVGSVELFPLGVAFFAAGHVIPVD